MPDRITDKAVTAAVKACQHARADGADDAQCWRLGLAAALPHLADQPATTGDDVSDETWIKITGAVGWDESAEHWDKLRTAVDIAVRAASQSADRDTCAEPLPVDGDPEAMQTCDHPALPGTDRCPIHDPRHQEYLDGLHAEIRHLKQAATDRDTETAALRAELANVREMLIAEHVHTTRSCGHDVGPMEVEGASDCSYCGPYHGATEFCPGRCDVVRVEHDHATASRRGGK